MANLTTTRKVTDEMLDQATRWIEGATNKVFYLIESQSEPGTFYRVDWNEQYKVLQCKQHNGRVCPAAEQGKHCYHLDIALAAEQEYQTDIRLHREADIEEAMTSRCAEEITEQSLIQYHVNQGVDRETAQRIVYA